MIALEQLERIRIHYSLILKTGSRVGTFLLVLGAALRAFQTSASPDLLSPLESPPWSALPQALSFNSDAIQLLGLLILVLTPIVRVAWSLVLYLQARERLMAFFTVLSLLFIAAGIVAKL